MPEIDFIHIKPSELLNQVHELKEQGCRLVQICCSKSGEGYELDYSFDRDYTLVDLKMPIEKDEEIVSISSVYGPAFLYENEINSLFGVKIKHISVDFNGNLYITAEKKPFAIQDKEGDA